MSKGEHCGGSTRPGVWVPDETLFRAFDIAFFNRSLNKEKA